MTTTFNPPAYCFTSAWATNSVLEGLVYETVGCPAVDVTTVAPSLSACCGPFSDNGRLLIATLTGCPEGYGPASSYVKTGLGSFDFAEYSCCPTSYGWTGKCQLSATNAFSVGGPATVTITFANVLFVTWTGTGAAITSTTPGETAQNSFIPSGSTPSGAQQVPTVSSIGLTPPNSGQAGSPHQSSSFPSRNIAAIIIPFVLMLLSAGAFVFHLLRKRRLGWATTADREPIPHSGPQVNSTELGSIPVNELNSLSRPLELHGSEPKIMIQEGG